jgi:lipoyl-dependent peroxiredoxin
MVDRKATAQWNGDLKSGSGTVSLESSRVTEAMKVSWPSRAERQEAEGETSPEELLAAAHAACFSMALSKQLADRGTPPYRLTTSAVATFSLDGGAHVSRVAITVVGSVPGSTAEAFLEAAGAAKEGCPISKALAGNVEITLDASLKSL